MSKHDELIARIKQWNGWDVHEMLPVICEAIAMAKADEDFELYEIESELSSRGGEFPPTASNAFQWWAADHTGRYVVGTDYGRLSDVHVGRMIDDDFADHLREIGEPFSREILERLPERKRLEIEARLFEPSQEILDRLPASSRSEILEYHSDRSE